jgi:hypothetical protein
MGVAVARVLVEWLDLFRSAGIFRHVSLLIAAALYFSESKDRTKQKHYQAWQVINSAQGKGGSGDRIEALEELHQDGVPPVDVDVSNAFLPGMNLQGIKCKRSPR